MGDRIHRWLALVAVVVVVVALMGWRTLAIKPAVGILGGDVIPRLGIGGSGALGTSADALPVSNLQLSQLVPYSTPLPDSLRPSPPQNDDTVVLPRDPFSTQPPPQVVQGQPIVAAESPSRREHDDTTWAVTATLMAGVFRAAIINDVVVHVGESVPGGARLTSVERDHVVLTDSKGTAHTVAVKEGER